MYEKLITNINPPFMIHFPRLVGFFSGSANLNFFFWLRLPAIVADVFSVILVWKILAASLPNAFRPANIALMAAAPASIMISGFHGQTDSIMVCLMLLSIYCIEVRQAPLLAGLALGMSLNIKVLPLIFIPTTLLYLKNFQQRFVFSAAAAGVVFVGWLPYIVQEPALILHRVMGYESYFGQWGITRLLNFTKVAAIAEAPILFYARFGRYVVLLILIAAALWMNYSLRKAPLFLQYGMTAFTFLSFTHGFGIQYLAWLVPWVVVLGAPASLAYYVSSGVFLFGVYTFWSGGFPWYFADGWRAGWWQGWLIVLELLCWVTVVGLWGGFVETCRRGSRPVEKGNVHQ